VTSKVERDRDFRLKKEELELKNRELDIREDEHQLRSSEHRLSAKRLYGDWAKLIFRYVILYAGGFGYALNVIASKSFVADLLPQYYRQLYAAMPMPPPWTAITIVLLIFYSVISTIGWRVQLQRARRGIRVKSRLQGQLETNDEYRSTSGLRENGTSPH
jgi:hypothetical protein